VKPSDPEYIDTYRVVTPYTIQQLSAGQSTSLTGVILPGQVKRYQQQAQARIGGAPAQGTPAQQATAAATTSTVQQAASGAAASQPAPARRAMQVHRPAANTNTAGAGRGKPAPSPAQPAAATTAQVKQEPTVSNLPASKSAATAAPSGQQAATPAPAQPTDNAAQQASQPPSQTASAQPSRTATPGAASALSNSTDSRRPPIEFK
jgi:hypothetical protein